MPGSEAKRRSRRLPALAAAIASSAALAACSGADPSETPPACLSDSPVYVEALSAAPGEVALDGETPISDCLVAEQSGGDLAAVGEQLIGAATTLNAEARADPGGGAAVRLGYLVGAVERGDEGIHADLERRLNAAARFNPSGEILPASFERDFGQGYAAGLESG